MRAILAALFLCLVSTGLDAKPSKFRHHGAVTQFNGDRYAPSVAQMSPNARDVTRAMRCVQGVCPGNRRYKKRHPRSQKFRRPAPGYVTPRQVVVKRNIYRRVQPRTTVAPRQVVKRNIVWRVAPRAVVHRNIFRGFAEELRNAGPSKSLAGVVAPLAAKARQLQSICNARIISAVRHTYIAGTGGRLSLHASGRAVDIAGNPSCLYANLRNWPGGVSMDYGRVRHVHLSYAPGGPEWGARFNHGGGRARRARYARRRG